MRLPVRTGAHVRTLSRESDGQGFVATTDGRRFVAAQAVVATGAYQTPRIPSVAAELEPRIRQLHSSEFHDVSQLQPGPVLIVGASNSGAEIAMKATPMHRVLLVGRDTGKMPMRPESRLARLFDPPFWLFINRIVRVDTLVGRKVLPLVRDHGGPLERVWPEDLEAAGVERIHARFDATNGGMPEIDGHALDVTNVIWCTGFRPMFDWIELPLRTDEGWPIHRRGVVEDVPGLYFIGLPFLYAAASALLGGVGRDAAYLAREIARRAATVQPAFDREIAARAPAA
jgi:putative flavoprotein involved in K+ transport